MKPEWTLKIKEEVEKQYNARFLRVVNYPEWLANVVPVPKDYFPLPYIDILVDNTAGHVLLSFMDGFSRYNQIKMAPEDMEKISFITPCGTYYYKVMPFGLKNTSATYQWATTTSLHDLIHKEVKVYVDDMIVKSKDHEWHIPALRKFFERIWFYKLRLNPKKCTFRVTSRKLLGFIISQRGIEVDHDKIKAIVEIKPPRTEKEIREFLGRIEYISRFIAQLIMTCEPIFRLLKKEVPTVWNEQCQEAFEKIKNYLMKPPILVPPIPKKPLLLYLTTTDTAMGALLAQYLEETRKENVIYYISKKMLPYEEKYSTLEKTCIELVWATHKLKHYMLAYKVLLIARMDHLKYLMEKHVQDGNTAKWTLLLLEFDIKYVTQKSVKGRAIVDYLAHCSPEEAEEIQEDFPDEDIMGIEVESWKMCFNKATNQNINGIGVLLISLKGTYIPFFGKLNFPATNNATECKACIMGLQVALGLGVKELEVYGDSTLIISQIQNK